MKKLCPIAISVVLLIAFTVPSSVSAFTILGTLVGGDLTDPEDDGDEASGSGFNATFFASSQPFFTQDSGPIPQGAFNVFDNKRTIDIGAGREAGWFDGEPNGPPWIVGAIFDQAHALSSFTVTSSNNIQSRTPGVWRIEGSNDTTDGFDGTWTTIYDHPTLGSDWTLAGQVNRYSPADGDVFLTTDPFSAFRLVVDALNGSTILQLAELEFFGGATSPEVALAVIISDVIALNLQQGIANSLDAKLDSALDTLQDLNENNDGAAVNKLQSFINAVNAQRGHSISEADADQLIAAAQAIIDQLTNG